MVYGLWVNINFPRWIKFDLRIVFEFASISVEHCTMSKCSKSYNYSFIEGIGFPVHINATNALTFISDWNFFKTSSKVGTTVSSRNNFYSDAVFLLYWYSAAVDSWSSRFLISVPRT